MGAPSVVLTALSVPYEELFGSDPKSSAIQFRARYGQPAAHHYLDIWDGVRGEGMCSQHGTRCAAPALSSNHDIVVVGFPCQPYSTQRAKRFAKDSVRNHPLSSVAEGALHHVARWRPKLALIENVPGWAKKAAGEAQSHMETFISALTSIGYHCMSVLLSSAAWVSAERERRRSQWCGMHTLLGRDQASTNNPGP
jgi:site-specific DNA-cytosine methylase